MAQQLIITAVLTLASMAMNAMRKIEGPRLDDLKVTVADYGTPMNYFKGTKRFDAVPIIWAEPLREEKHRRKTKGGKYNEYTYFATFAFLIADHLIDGVTRIWFDKHLVYDVTGSGPITPITGGRTVRNPGGTPVNEWLRIYLGTDTQEADPRMLATIEAQHGAGSCPAYRRMAYCVIEELPVEKFGNRIPQISVEAVSTSTPSYPLETILASGGAKLNIAFFGTRMTVVVGSTLQVVDLVSRETILTVAMPASMNNGGIGMTETGAFYAMSGVFFEPTFWLIGADGDGPTVVTTVSDAYVDGAAYAGGYLCAYPYIAAPHILVFNGTKIEEVSSAFAPDHYFTDEDGIGWATGDISATELGMFQIPAGPLKTITVPSGAGDSFVMDNGQGQYFAIKGGNCLLIDKDTFTVTDSAAAPSYNSDDLRLAFRAIGNGAASIWIKYTEVSTRTLEILRSISPPNWSPPVLSFALYEPINHALIGFPNAEANLRMLFLDRIAGGGVTVQTLFEWVCGLCGVDPADVEASAGAADTVPAWSFTQGAGKQAIEPVLDLFGYVVRPHDFQLQLVKRGAASLGTIAASEFAAADDSLYEIVPKTGTDMPQGVSLTFADLARDQQPNTIEEGRRAGTVDSARVASFDMKPLALDADTARNLVVRWFRGLWNRNETITNALDGRRRKIEPGDVYDLTLTGGATRTAMVTKMTLGADDRIPMEWEREAAELATLPDLTGAPMDGRAPSVMYLPTAVRALMLDVPLLRDADNTVNPGLYYGAGPYSSGGVFAGATIDLDDGSGDYDIEVATVDSSSPATWGFTTDALADASAFIWDRGGSFNVKLNYGSLVAATEADCNANPRLNQAAIGAPGRWEIIQFTTPVLEGDGSYTVSGLKRGRRGSEWATGEHLAGDQFVLLSQIDLLEAGAGDIGNDLSFKAVAAGSDPDAAIPVTVEDYSAAPNRPWAPAQFRARKDAATGDWIFTWRRRSRVAGDWAPGTPPLGESAENYELKLYDGSTLVRVIPATSQTATWTAAQQVTDFGVGQLGVDAGVLQAGDLADGFEATATFVEGFNGTYRFALVNPGAEAGSTAGWTQGPRATGAPGVLTAPGGGSPHAGAYAFVATTSGTAGEFYQQAVVPEELWARIDGGDGTLNGAAYHIGWSGDADSGALYVECYDEANVLLDSLENAQSDPASWTLQTASLAIPPGTRSVRIGTYNVRAFGFECSSYWDDFTLQIVIA